MAVSLRRLVLIVTASALVLTGCSSQAPSDAQTPAVPSADVESILVERGWDELSGEDLVDALDRLPVAERPADLLASVRADAVTLQATDGSTNEIPLDRGFYLSVAPYRDQTHPCGFHSLTTCRGELSSTPVSILVTDASTGESVVEEETTTFDNGFVGVWLPAGRTLSVSVSSGGESATTEVTTGADDPTCLTTLRLS